MSERTYTSGDTPNSTRNRSEIKTSAILATNTISMEKKNVAEQTDSHSHSSPIASMSSPMVDIGRHVDDGGDILFSIDISSTPSSVPSKNMLSASKQSGNMKKMMFDMSLSEVEETIPARSTSPIESTKKHHRRRRSKTVDESIMSRSAPGNGLVNITEDDSESSLAKLHTSVTLGAGSKSELDDVFRQLERKKKRGLRMCRKSPHNNSLFMENIRGSTVPWSREMIVGSNSPSSDEGFGRLAAGPTRRTYSTGPEMDVQWFSD